MGLFEMLGLNRSKEAKKMMEEGAVVVDVRTTDEFREEHLDGSVNIPLAEISDSIEQIKEWGKPIVLCCASGIRSGRARSLLEKNGLQCINGGGWKSLR